MPLSKTPPKLLTILTNTHPNDAITAAKRRKKIASIHKHHPKSINQPIKEQ